MRNCYVVLGIPRNETPRGIRNAYRHLAKKHHPDRAGQAVTARFQDISQAYQTLSHPDTRRSHDAALDEETRARRRGEPINILDPPARFQPSFDELQERFLLNFTGGWTPKSELAEGLNVEVILSTEEATYGVILPLQVPTLRLCDRCDGTGFEWPFRCTECRQTGMLLVEETIPLAVPPLIRSGTIFEFPLDRLGIHNFFLRAHVLVDDDATRLGG
jgi:DnaJ-class molecular chaperone